MLAAVVVQKSILSTSVGTNVFRYIETDEILELEAGITNNEPGLIALTKAIEKAVYSLIMEMANRELWGFKNPHVGRNLVNQYLEEDGRLDRSEISDQKMGDGKTS